MVEADIIRVPIQLRAVTEARPTLAIAALVPTNARSVRPAMDVAPDAALLVIINLTATPTMLAAADTDLKNALAAASTAVRPSGAEAVREPTKLRVFDSTIPMEALADLSSPKSKGKV